MVRRTSQPGISVLLTPMMPPSAAGRQAKPDSAFAGERVLVARGVTYQQHPPGHPPRNHLPQRSATAFPGGLGPTQPLLQPGKETQIGALGAQDRHPHQVRLHRRHIRLAER